MDRKPHPVVNLETLTGQRMRKAKLILAEDVAKAASLRKESHVE